MYVVRSLDLPCVKIGTYECNRFFELQPKDCSRVNEAFYGILQLREHKCA